MVLWAGSARADSPPRPAASSAADELKDPSDVIRARAVAHVAALADGEEAVLAAAKDKSWRVRLAVAQALSGYPNRRGAATAERLLDDPSPTVQAQAVASVAGWPLPLAGPVLLAAMDKPVVMTRKTAAEQLAARWAPAGEYRFDDPADTRRGVLERLGRRFRQEFGAVDFRIAPANVGTDGDQAPLAPTAAVLAELERIGSPDVSVRRRAAGQLARLAAERPLGRLAVERLATLVARESDALVWQSVLSAVADEAGEAAVRMAAAAIGHAAPEVRRRACEHLAAHPHPKHAPLLLPALDDASPEVARAAVRAIGRCGIDDTRPLRQLLGASNAWLRLEAAVALVRLGDRSGVAALERLAYNDDPTIRRQVATAMGDSGDRSLAPALIRLLDDHLSVRRAALEALPKVVGRDVAGDAGQPPADQADRAEAWKRWLRSGGQ